MKNLYCTSKLIAFSVFLYWFSFSASAQHKEYFPDPDTAIQHKLEDWRDLKFGLLMHWGTYSQWGIVESWSICPEDLGWATGARKKGMSDDNYNDYLKKYEALKTTFNPTKFNPQQWADAAKEAGMKYVIFTTKHHDGFCMFDTKYTDYKVTSPDCPFSKNPKSNIAKEIFSAFRNDGLWTGAYFSKPDWHSDYYWWKKFPPADRNANYSIQKYPEQWKKFVDYTHNQLKELVTDYGNIDILWLDGGWVRPKTQKEVEETLNEVIDDSRWARNPQSQDIDMPRLVKEVRAIQPKVLVVDREVPGPQQNYLTPEQTIPAEGLSYPWETCMTMATSWSYVPNDKYKTADELIRTLVDIVSKGGNLLLNIGPSPDGEWSDSAYSRLKEIGDWMKINSQAIYATRSYSVFGEGANIRFTQSKDGKTKYIFLFNFPTEKFAITKMNFASNAQLTLFGYKKPIKWQPLANGVEITIPASAKPASKHVWVLQVKE